MSEVIRLTDQAESFELGREQAGYSKVILNVTDELYYEAGTDSGETLEVDCPWGTQAICDAILDSVRGYAYKPYQADGALLDPSAELGDTINIKGTQSGLYSVDTDFGSLMSASVSAPAEDDIDSEYPYKPSSERKIERRLADVSSEIGQVADEVYANVVRKTGGTSQSFGWSLTADGFILVNNNSEIFRADANGITITGRIQATSGFIGSSNNGFNIQSNAIWYGINSASASGYGVYIGSDGINLGGNFRVDSGGNLTANSGTFSGSVRASSIRSDGVDGWGGSFSGSGLSSRSVGTGRLTSGINTSLGYADDAQSLMLGNLTARWLKSTNSSFSNATISSLSFKSYNCGWIQVATPGGGTAYAIGRS